MNQQVLAIFPLHQVYPMEDLDLALSMAREKLPLAQDYPNDTMSILLSKETFYKDPLHIFGIGAPDLKETVSFNFQKLYINDILVGWEFVCCYR